MAWLARIAVLLVGASPAAPAGAAEIDLRHSAQLVVSGPLSDAGVGAHIDNVGDVDGDGREDLVVAGVALAGSTSVDLVYGRDGYDYEDLASPHASSAISGFSSVQSATGVGDVNGDGLADIAIEGPLAEGEASAVSIVFGRRSRSALTVRPNQPYGFRIIPRSADAHLSLAGLGDVNGDGMDDVGIGVAAANAVTVVFGAGDSRTVQADQLGARGYRILGTGEFGSALAGVGDFDGDGSRDVAVGAPRTAFDSTGTGSVFAISLARRTSDLDLAGDWNGFRVDGRSQREHSLYLGRGVERVGDLDDDGLADLWMSGEGSRSLLVRGSASQETVRSAALAGRGEVVTHPVKQPVAGGGDWNGDEKPDLVVAECLQCGGSVIAEVIGAELDGQEMPSVDVLLRAELELAILYDYRGQPRGMFPSAGVAAGDFNGDGRTDLALASSGLDADGRRDAGGVHVLWDAGGSVAPGSCANSQTGTPAGDALTGTNGGDVLAGHAGDDAMSGLGGDDCLRGGDGRDSLMAGAGDDIADAGPGADSIETGTGDDLIAPGAGADVARAGEGDDLLDTRDRERDSIDCGGGVDFAYMDSIDAARDCGRYGPNVEISQHTDANGPHTFTGTALAYDAARDRYLLAWGQDRRVLARLVDGRGFPLGDVRALTRKNALEAPFGSYSNPLAAASLAGGDFVVAWTEARKGAGWRTVSQVVAPDGAPRGRPRFLGRRSSAGSGQITASLAAGPNGRVLAVWDAIENHRTVGIRGRLLGAAGRPLGKILRLTGRRYAPRGPIFFEDRTSRSGLAGGRNGWMLAFVGRNERPFARALGARGRRQGAVRALRRAANCCATYIESTRVAYDVRRGRFLVVWATWLVRTGSSGVRGRFVASDGKALGRRPRLLAGPRHESVRAAALAPVIVHGGGRFLLVWRTLGGRAPRAAWLDRTGRKLKEVKVGNQHSAPVAAGYSPVERRFLIPSLALDTTGYWPVNSGPLGKVFARTWPGAPPR